MQLSLARVPRVHGTAEFLDSTFWHPLNLAILLHCVSPLKIEDLLVFGTRYFKFSTQALRSDTFGEPFIQKILQNQPSSSLDYWHSQTLCIEGAPKRSKLTNCRFTTISSHFVAIVFSKLGFRQSF